MERDTPCIGPMVNLAADDYATVITELPLGTRGGRRYRNVYTGKEFGGSVGEEARDLWNMEPVCKYFTLKRKDILTRRGHEVGRLPLLAWVAIESFLHGSVTLLYEIKTKCLSLENIPLHAVVIKYTPGHYIPVSVAATPNLGILVLVTNFAVLNRSMLPSLFVGFGELQGGPGTLHG